MTPVRVAIVSSIPDRLLARLAAVAEQLVIVTERPDVVIAYGGDGTLLQSERAFPGVPKVLLRASQVCEQHHVEGLATIPQLLIDQAYTTNSEPKLVATVNNTSVIAVNDVIIGHAQINTTIRLQLSIDGVVCDDTIVGDGVVCATPLGSTGYYYSIARTTFADGIGVAFNNPVNVVDHHIVGPRSRIGVVVQRGPGLVAVDNSEERIAVGTGDHITVEQSTQPMNYLQFAAPFEQFNIIHPLTRVPYGQCQVGRHPY